MNTEAIRKKVEQYLNAYVSGDRSVMEAALTRDFTFSSPYDDHIDRAQYFERCWPNHDSIKGFQLEKVVSQGDDAFILYECTVQSGLRFRNTEHLVFDGEKLAKVEVYFGDPPAGVSREANARFQAAAMDAWRRKAFTVAGQEPPAAPA